MGFQKPLNCKQLDAFVSKAISLKCPLKVLPLLKNHRAMRYYPDPKLLTQTIEFFDNSKDFISMKILFAGITRRL